MLTTRVVLITGAGRGLGRAMAVAFAKKGYAVGINYLKNETEAKATQASLASYGVSTLLLPFDVSNSQSVQEMINTLQATWGRVDVLVNNAGIARNQLLSKMTDEDWAAVLAVNLTGVFYTTRAVLPLMQARREGAIINIASFTAQNGIRGAGNYAVAKAGVITLTKNTALEEGIHNIRANAVMPGFHVTEMNEDVWEMRQDHIRSQHLLKDMPKREELADFVVTVAELKTVSGQVFAYESRLI